MSGSSHRPGAPRPTCRHCGEVIGVYEPLMARGTDGDRETSLAAEPDCCGPDEACYHSGCYEFMMGGERMTGGERG